MEQNDTQRALMAILFAAGEPVDAQRLAASLKSRKQKSTPNSRL